MKQRSDYTVYTPELIEKLRALVKRLSRSEGVKAVGRRLGLSERRAREVYSSYVEPSIKASDAAILELIAGNTSGLADAAPRKIRRLFLDLETSPNIGTFWRCGYKLNIDHANIIKERAIICIGWKWEGDDEVHCWSWDKNQDDKELLQRFIEILNDADEIVAHNATRFDWPWLRTRALFHGLPPIPEVKVVDTLTWAKRKFQFNSNRLDYIAKFLGLGGKIKTGFDLWKAVVLQNDLKALADMMRYCQKDVTLLEQVWAKLCVLVPAKTHAGVLGGGDKWTSPYDGSTDVHLSKTRVTAAGTIQYQMLDNAGRYFSISGTAYQGYLDAKKSRLGS